MKALNALKRIIGEFRRTPHLLEEIREELANRTKLLNGNLEVLVEGFGNAPRNLRNLDRTAYGRPKVISSTALQTSALDRYAGAWTCTAVLGLPGADISSGHRP